MTDVPAPAPGTLRVLVLVSNPLDQAQVSVDQDLQALAT